MTMAKKHFIAAGVCGIGLVLSMALRKPGNQPNFERSVIDTFYYRDGRKGDFEAAAYALINPDDVALNDRKKLAQWLLSAKMIPQIPDSMKKK